MAIVPLILSIILVITGVLIIFNQKASIERWVGYNIAASGLLVALESMLAFFIQQVLSMLNVICLATLLISFIVIICGYGKFIED